MTNQPTDATPYCSCGDALDSSATCPNCLASLSLQLATAQAQAKALEAWGLKQFAGLQQAREAISVLIGWMLPGTSITDSPACMDSLTNYEQAYNAADTPKPKPVDASSLARIARVALEALIPCEGGCTCSMCVLSQTLTDADRALAQALAGGA